MRSGLRRVAKITLAFVGCLGAAAADAQDYPSRAVSIVVANSPASSPDLIARIMAPTMSKIMNQPVLVENKPGAAETIGYGYVVNQAPKNGYTLALAIVANLAAMPVTVKNLTFDPLKDIPPVMGLVESRYVFGGAASFPWKTFEELVAYAKANPNKLNWGTSSQMSRLVTEALMQDIGMQAVFIPYSGGGPYIQALVAGQINYGFVGEAAVAGNEKFRILALTGAQRSPRLPNVPTFIELGQPQIKSLEFSLNAAAGVPKPVLDKIYSVGSQTLKQAEVRAAFAKILYEVVELTPEAAAKSLANQAQLFAAIAKKSGIQPE